MSMSESKKSSGQNTAVSIIIPLYNAEPLFRRCIESARAQTIEEPIEIIVVDDASTDQSGALADHAAEMDERILVRHLAGGNCGPANARNAGLDVACGEYVFFLDADDSLTPDAIKELYAAAKAVDSDWTIGDFHCYINDADIRADAFFFPDDTLFTDGDICELIKSDMESTRQFIKTGTVWGKLYRRSVMVENGIRFDAELRQCEDMAFNRNYMGAARKVYYLRKKLYNHYLNPGMNTARTRTIMQDMLSFKKYAHATKDALQKHGMDEKDAIALGKQTMAFFAVKLTTSFFLNLQDGKMKSDDPRRDAYIFVHTLINDPEIHDSFRTYRSPPGESAVIPFFMGRRWTRLTIYAFRHLTYRIIRSRRSNAKS